ncbi:MAG: NAD-dependent deacylase [Dehalococcoidales bacterium]|nr:NAD-dependent deacylase [Dehalococcoidales bacterium]
MKDIEQAAKLILNSAYVLCLTGAGISVESGIRPFRGPGGLWTEFGEPPMDGYQRLLQNPKKHWEEIARRGSRDSEFVRALGEAKPNPAHLALAELEQLGILKYLITQNIDNLHLADGSYHVAEIHGNSQKLRCVRCGNRYAREAISLEILPPQCPRCRGLIKTDTVMFGEPIPKDMLRLCQRETDKADCMIVVGTSAFVYPAAGFPLEVKQKGGILIEINPYATEISPLCDILLKGKAGEILPQLVVSIKAIR